MEESLLALSKCLAQLNAREERHCSDLPAVGEKTVGGDPDWMFSQMSPDFQWPLGLLARDLGSTTSRCDLLRAQLNKADIKHGAEHHQKIDWLFVTLQRLVSVGCSSAATQR